MKINGDTILITGSGIGRALVEALHAKGNKTIVTGRNANKLRAVEKSIPGVIGRELDVEPDRRAFTSSP